MPVVVGWVRDSEADREGQNGGGKEEGLKKGMVIPSGAVEDPVLGT